MFHERMTNADFFALPDRSPDDMSGFGMAGLKEEGAPLYRDEAGYYWSLQEASDGTLWRCMA